MSYSNNMRILPVNIYSLIPKSQTNYRTNKSQNLYMIKPLTVDTVSFGRSATNGEVLRKLIKYKIPDMYTGQVLLDGELLENWMKNEIYSRPISSIVQKLGPYKNVLHKAELRVFNMIEQLSRKKPNETLDNAIKKLALKARPELSEIQGPIINELITESKKLPKENKEKFDKLIQQTILQLNNEPISVNFSIKDFRYKLSRISLGIKQRGVEEEINAINKIMSLSKDNNIKGKKNKVLSQIMDEKNRHGKMNVSKYANMIANVESYFSKSVLKNDKDLNDLISTAKDLIEQRPTIINFSRKNFIHNLEAVVTTMEDKKLAHSLIKIARKLPTSHQEHAAFLMKESTSSSKKIFFDLFSGSVATLDHLVAYSKGGKDGIFNYGMTSQYNNSARGNKSIETMLREIPEAYDNCQKFIDRLIVLSNNGIFAKVGLNKAYIIDFAKVMKKLSPKEKSLILDTSRLR